ncbi:MAG: DUF6488 family protein [Gammaproteobacteria bacterium]|nr:DUF6488 family protein [Gammaproteobacteria bacterium]
MKILATTLVLSSLFFGTPTMAGSNHDHGHSHANTPVNKETVEKNAERVLAALIENKKLDNSWTSATASSSEKKMINGGPEWLVIFINEKATDIEKKKLYMFMTLGGDYIAANFSGK